MLSSHLVSLTHSNCSACLNPYSNRIKKHGYIKLKAILLSPLLQAYMFKYDSTHGNYKGTINVIDDSTLEINGKQVKVVSKRYCLKMLTHVYPSSIVKLGINIHDFPIGRV